MSTNTKPKYRIKAISVASDIYCIQKRFFFIWYTCPSFGAGSKYRITQILDELIGIEYLDQT